jgi:hypothetical protein
MVSIDQIAEWCRPWNHLFSHSKVIAGSVTGAHILALMFGGGFAIGADRLTLRVDPSDTGAVATQLRDVRDIHAPVIVALAVLALTGVALALADVETFVPSLYFWIKLTLVAVLLGNGWVLRATERRLAASAARDEPVTAAAWSRMRVLAWSSVLLWTATAVAGIVLSNIA